MPIPKSTLVVCQDVGPDIAGVDMFDCVGQQSGGSGQREAGHGHQLASDLVDPLREADPRPGEVDPPRIIGLNDR